MLLRIGVKDGQQHWFAGKLTSQSFGRSKFSSVVFPSFASAAYASMPSVSSPPVVMSFALTYSDCCHADGFACRWRFFNS